VTDNRSPARYPTFSTASHGGIPESRTFALIVLLRPRPSWRSTPTSGPARCRQVGLSRTQHLMCGKETAHRRAFRSSALLVRSYRIGRVGRTPSTGKFQWSNDWRGSWLRLEGLLLAYPYFFEYRKPSAQNVPGRNAPPNWSLSRTVSFSESRHCRWLPGRQISGV
jgi:hypothetical protein